MDSVCRPQKAVSICAAGCRIASSRNGAFRQVHQDGFPSLGFLHCRRQALFVSALCTSERVRPLGIACPSAVAQSPGTTLADEPAGGSRQCDDLCTSVMGLCDTVVGVLGGGQLGRMLCQAASPMGIKIAVLDPERNCPAAGLAFRQSVGSFRDTDAVREFATGCGVLTVEIEHVDVDTLDALSREGVDIEPKPSTIRTIQDKYAQKVHFSQHGVPLSSYMQINSAEAAEEAGVLFGYPLMLKSRKLAYDGRGNAVAHCKEELSKAVSSLGGFERGLYAEKWAPFVKELAVMVARGRDGSISSFPVVETTHKDNICHTVEAPAAIPVETVKKALDVAQRAVASLQGAGVFGVELFLLGNGEVLLNEVAPRPHNSGHYTIEACYVSQYEQHLRAILGLPLGDTAMKVPAALMVNLLGEDEGDAGFILAHDVMRKALFVPGARVHWYEKPEIRRQRKMGHITVVGPAAGVVRSRVETIFGHSEHDPENLRVPAKEIEGLAPTGAPVVAVIMGSDSDLPVMKAAAEVLESFGVPYELTVVSAHRTPDRMVEYARAAEARGFKVIIAGAGGAAHLPGMVAALTPLPVIGVPVKTSSTDGLDSLFSIVQMPRGVPVATVAIQNASNAGLLAVRMLGSHDASLRDRMSSYQAVMRNEVLSKAGSLENVGWRDYLKQRS